MFDLTTLLTPVVTVPVIAAATIVIALQWWDKRRSLDAQSDEHIESLGALESRLDDLTANYKAFQLRVAKGTVALIVAAEKEIARRVQVERETGYSLADAMDNPSLRSRGASSKKSGDERLLDAIFGTGNRPPDGFQVFSLDDIKDEPPLTGRRKTAFADMKNAGDAHVRTADEFTTDMETRGSADPLADETPKKTPPSAE